MNVTRGVDSEQNDIIEATCVRLNAKAGDVAANTPVIERRSLSRSPDEVVVAIEAAGVNPSDVKAATGLMPMRCFRAHRAVTSRGGWSPDRANGWGRPSSGLRGISASAATERMPRISSSKQRRWLKR